LPRLGVADGYDRLGGQVEDRVDLEAVKGELEKVAVADVAGEEFNLVGKTGQGQVRIARQHPVEDEDAGAAANQLGAEVRTAEPSSARHQARSRLPGVAHG